MQNCQLSAISNNQTTDNLDRDMGSVVQSTVCPVHSTVHIRAYTHSQRTPHNSTDKQHSTDTNGAQHTDCRCAESPIVIFQPPDKLQRQSDALLVIYEPKHTKSAICAFTRMHTNQPKREERQHLLYGVDVYVPLRPDVAKPRTVVASRVHLCPTNSAMSTRASQKSEVEGEGNDPT